MNFELTHLSGPGAEFINIFYTLLCWIDIRLYRLKVLKSLMPKIYLSLFIVTLIVIT